MRTVFLDRDGVINQKPPPGRYVTSWPEFRLLPDAPQAIRLLNQAGFRVIVVTNQRGVARGLMTDTAVQDIHRRMLDALSDTGARLDAVYYCPHEEGACDCRKPGPGLFEQARSAFPDITFQDSFVIGDSDRDLEAGRRLGARLIRIGHTAAPDELSAPSLLEAVIRHVLSDHGDDRAHR